MNQSEETSFDIKNFTVPISILLVGVMISGAIFFGLKSKSTDSSKDKAEKVLGEAENPSQPPEKKAKISIDDDPVMGDKNKAKVAIVEFSDYECSFCNRFRTQTLGQIKKDYIDTGKVILVFRDFPLDFHNPAAEREAMAAECVQEQGGDSKYFQYHDKIFEKTLGGGKGISVDELAKMAQEIGLKENELKNCLEKEQFKEEIAKDMADAAKVGISGTPGFVIGKLDSQGNVDGVLISGAQPYSIFKDIIEAELK